MCKQYCIARHDEKMCFLPSCRYHIILIGNIKELLQKMDAFCFNYQHVDYLYTLFKYRFSGKMLSRVDSFLIICRGQFISSTKVDDWPECLASEEETLEEKLQKKTFDSSFQKTKSTEISGSLFADGIEQIEKNKIQSELKSLADCFLDGHGNFTSDLVPLKKSLKTNYFLNYK